MEHAPLKVTKGSKPAIVCQLLVAVLAGCLIALFIHTELTATVSPLIPQTEYVTVLGLGIALLLVSLLAVACQLWGRRTGLHVTQIVLSVILLAFTIAGAALINNTPSSNTKQMANLSRRWNSISNQEAMAIQAWGQCCGYSNFRDRVQPPCQAKKGCAPAMLQEYQGYLDALFWPLVVLACLEIIALVMTSAAVIRWWRMKALIGVDQNALDRQEEEVRKRKEPDWTVPIFK